MNQIRNLGLAAILALSGCASMNNRQEYLPDKHLEVTFRREGSKIGLVSTKIITEKEHIFNWYPEYEFKVDTITANGRRLGTYGMEPRMMISSMPNVSRSSFSVCLPYASKIDSIMVRGKGYNQKFKLPEQIND